MTAGATYVFVGPTLSRSEAQAELSAVYLPPAAQGDVYRIARLRPSAIGIIDGYYDRIPSVWHKEILWAIAEGIPVYGAASMGALRAAELAPFGMHGTGRIFAGYRDGVLTDDDEVAITHATEEDGYVCTSEAMVNIRCTFSAAYRDGVIDSRSLQVLLETAKGLYFADRSYPRILQLAAQRGVSDEVSTRLRYWLRNGRIDQKRADAMEMLAAMRRAQSCDDSVAEPNFRFSHTAYFDRMVETQRLTELAPDPSWARGTEVAGTIDELCLDRAGFEAARTAAFARVLGLETARRHGLLATDDATEAELDRMRNGAAPTAFGEWCRSNSIDPETLRRLAGENALLRRVESLVGDGLVGALVDHLMSTGRYGALHQRALAKDAALSLLSEPLFEPRDDDDADLWQWYFVEYLEMDCVPDDLAGYAREIGFAQLDDLASIVRREYLFCRTHTE